LEICGVDCLLAGLVVLMADGVADGALHPLCDSRCAIELDERVAVVAVLLCSACLPQLHRLLGALAIFE